MTEHDYLEWLVQERYFAEVEANVDPFNDRINAELKGDRNFEKIFKLERLSYATHQQAWENKLRSLDILRWLKIDSQLRAKGLPSYPDFMERESEPSSIYSPDLKEF
jgi:hypothetical protein